MNGETILCLDLGGTSLKCALVKDFTVLKRYKTPTDISRGLDGIKETFCRGLEYFGAEKYTAAAVSSAGKIDSEKGCVVYATSLLPGYTGFDLKKFIGERTGKPCACLNDGYAAALCESAEFGERFHSVVVLTLGTGVGGAYVENGKILNEPEEGIGHIVFRKGGKKCNCGRQGCVEQYISGTALNGRLNGLSAEELWKRYAAGDSKTAVAVTDWLADLRGVCDFLYMRRPYDAVIFGGGLADSGNFWFDESTFRGAPYRAALAKHGNDAGVLGAYLFACKSLRESQNNV